MELISQQYIGIQEDSILSEALSLENKALDNEWLAQQVTNKTISQDCLDKLNIIKRDLEAIYPGLWGINVVHSHMNIQKHYRVGQPPYQPYGVYFEYEDFDESDEYTTLSEDEIYGVNEDHFENNLIVFYQFDIILKFESYTIINSKNHAHDILDTYVKLRLEQEPEIEVQADTFRLGVRFRPNDPNVIENEGFKYKFRDWKTEGRIYGNRGKVTANEWRSSYAHSHLQSRSRRVQDFLAFGPFCLGSGEIIQTLSMLNSQFSSELFQLYLFQVDAYLRWESLEGTPHIKMSNVVSGTPLRGYPKIKLDNCTNYFSDLKSVLSNNLMSNLDISLDLNWKIEDGKLCIIDDDKFDTICKIYGNNFRSYDEKYAFIFDAEGRIYNKTVLSVASPMPTDVTGLDTTYFVFRGEKTFLQIVPVEAVEVITDYFVIHPDIKAFIKEKIESYANYSKVRSDTTRRAHQALSLTTNI